MVGVRGLLFKIHHPAYQEEKIMLPDYIDEDALNGFLNMRKRIKKPLTDNAFKRALANLDRLKQRGEDITLVLNQSEDRCWAGLFPVSEGYYEELGIDRNQAKTNVKLVKLTDRSWAN